MGKIGSNFFYCIFGIRMTQFVKKKQKKKSKLFDPGDGMECLECVECGPIEGQGEFCHRGDLHGSKGLY